MKYNFFIATFIISFFLGIGSSVAKKYYSDRKEKEKNLTILTITSGEECHYIKNGKIISPRLGSNDFNNYQRKSIENYDTLSYGILSDFYSKMTSNYGDLFLSSLLMANKYHFPKAYFNVYLALMGSNKPLWYKSDNCIKDFSIYYLAKGCELGDLESKIQLGELYLKGQYVNKNVSIGRQLLKGTYMKEFLKN
jgi:hypothetical protein